MTCNKVLHSPTCEKDLTESCEISSVPKLRFTFSVVVQADSSVFRIPCYVYHWWTEVNSKKYLVLSALDKDWGHKANTERSHAINMVIQTCKCYLLVTDIPNNYQSKLSLFSLHLKYFQKAQWLPFIFAWPLGKWATVAWVLKYLGVFAVESLILSSVQVGASLGWRKSEAVASSQGTDSPYNPPCSPLRNSWWIICWVHVVPARTLRRITCKIRV